MFMRTYSNVMQTDTDIVVTHKTNTFYTHTIICIEKNKCKSNNL